jgi:uroporphyrin-III C-methyltransferase
MTDAQVSFVGAGPGDPELITVKGLERLARADVVIHDRLVAPELLGHTRAGAERIDVGKTRGRPCMGQENINWLIVDRARHGGRSGRGARVVRLKGGDPGVFGRLAEEIAAVRAAGIPFEVVPGVTAAAASAARTGISLTERGSASMVILATGADQHGRAPASLDWELLARADATLVFYMPVAALGAIAASLTALGRDPREPAIVVEGVGTPCERMLPARLGEVAAVARAAGVESPAILMTGPTVRDASVPASARTLVAVGA